MDLKDYVASIPDFPKKGIIFRDITPIIQNGDAFNEATNKLAQYAKKVGATIIAGPEARGFIFGSILANKLGIGHIPVRKQGKIPSNYVEKTFYSTKEYGQDILEIPKLVNDTYKDKRVYILDDIYATGNTINAITNTLTELGAKVIGIGVAINITNLNCNNDVFSLIDIEET